MFSFVTRLLKWSGFVISCRIELLFLYFCIAICCSLFLVSPPAQKADKSPISIYLRTNGVHLDLVLPIKNEVMDWNSKIPYPFADDSTIQVNYLAFGWGEKGFFLLTPKWSDFKLSTALKSLFFLGTSAMHVSYYSKVSTSANTVKINLTKRQYAKLTQFILSEFKVNESGRLQEIKQKSYGKYDGFYETRSSYNILYTCNSWVNDALKEAEQKHCLWTPLSAILFNTYQQN